MFRVLADMYACDEGRVYISARIPQLGQSMVHNMPLADFRKMLLSADDNYKLTGAVILYCTDGASLQDFIMQEHSILNHLHISIYQLQRPNYGFPIGTRTVNPPTVQI